MFGLLRDKVLPSLVLDRVGLPQTDYIIILLDLYHLLKEQVATMARRAFAHLWIVHQLSPYLAWEALLSIAHAFVTSRLNYCNTVYVGLPLKTIRKFQLVQNVALQVVNGARCMTHIAALLHEVHWLPVSFQVQFKVLMVTYKALHGLELENQSAISQDSLPS